MGCRVLHKSQKPDKGNECKERWCNGEEAILAVSQALINPRASSLGRYHQPCGTACHTFPWTQIGFSLQAHLHPRAGLGPAGLAGPGEAHTFSACQSTEQERAAL